MDTPGYPKAPHTTPSSANLFNPKRPRPPVRNPFDKFSQQDFDAWIGKLTGDLEKALGYEEVIQSQSSFPQSVEQTDDEYDDSDSYVEDSFAEVKARRVLDKGKARDPREGPGLGPKSGDIEQPIEILSDEEGEGEGEQLLEFEGSAEGEPDESYEQGKEEDGEEREGEDSDIETENWSRRWQRNLHTTAGGSTRRPASHDMEQVVESGESGSDEYEEDEEVDNGEFIGVQSPDGASQLSSDEEAGTANRRREEEEEAFLSEEDAEGVESSPAPVLKQGNESKFQDEEDMQPSDEDTSFPPHSVNRPGDIRDPWAQVAKYAEDYYAGGDVIFDGRSRLSPHHLGINDDDTGFLTPDVVNPDVDVKEEEAGEGEDDSEDEFAKGDLEDTETQEPEPELDENDHLFNRLRSYTQPGPVVFSTWQGPRTSFVINGPGSNVEPILVDSDEEPEEQSVTVGQHPKGTPSDDIVRPSEEAVVTHEDERSSEFCDQSIILDASVEPQDKVQTQQSTDEQVQTSTEAGHPEIPSLRDPPPGSSIVHEIPVPVRADADTINDMSYLRLGDTPKDARIDSGFYTHVSIDAPSPVPHSKILDSTSGLQSESNAPTATGGNEGQALGEMAAQLEVESRVTTNASAELYVSGQNTPYKEIDEEMDELDDDGPWPLMTSDLDYPLESHAAEVKDESVRDSIEPPEAVVINDSTFPSQALEVEGTEHENYSGIHIFVEEADEDEPGTSFKPITINVQPPTPLIMSESEFEGSPTSPNETGSPDNVHNASISRPTPPVTQSMTEELVLKGETMRHIGDTGSNDDFEAPKTPDQKSVFVDEILKVEEVAEGVEEVGIADAMNSGEQESMYIVQEPTIGSTPDDLAEHDRGISIDIASVPSDDIISTVEAGHVEDVPPDTDLKEMMDAECSDAEVESTHVEDVQSPNEVSEAVKGSDIEGVAVPSTATEVPIVTRATPEVVDEDYFAHPSTPIMSSTNLDMLGYTSTPSGGLPSIIQLPDTPQRVLSPGSTPAPGPTPVSIAIEPGILKVLKENPSLFSAASSSTPISQQPRRTSGAEIARSETKFSNIENTIAQQTSLPQSSSFKASNHTHSESSEQVSTNLPTFLPVPMTVKPVLYVDPYPYNLSTPLPYPQQEEDASEDATDQDNSFSSPSLNEKELDGTTLNKAIASGSSGPGEEAPKLVVETPAPQSDNAKPEQDLVDVEAEANALIDEFLVDEPESDTDADGEADPEFTVLESSVSARTSEGIMDKESEGPTLLTTNMSEGSRVAAKEVGPQEWALEVAKGTRMKVDEQEDSLKTMGNDSLVAPGGASDVERNEKSGEEKKEKRIQEANEVEPLDFQTAPISGTPVEVSSAEFVPAPPPSQEPPLRDTSPGDALSTSTRECMKSNVVQHDSPSEVNTGPNNFAQQKEEISNLAPEDIEIPQARSLVTLPRIKTLGIPLNAQESRTEGSPRRVQVSLEDPYNADNDSDREPGLNADRAGKRKRSLSEASNGESPIAPRSASVAKGKGKTSRQSTRGASRPRKKPSLLSSSITSRSPSVASTVVSDVSSLLSPSYLSLSSSDPRPFIHAHSRRKLGNAPTTVQQQRHKQLQKVVPGSRSQDGVLRAENVLTKAPTGSSALGSSPMTRSHCRYHKISIPKTENGPRIHFLVPGCSLNDAELIEEEEIEDHGEAIIRGDTLIADKIETINFEPYLLWAMRQLVGTELLRENEVYYLPEPNETIVRSAQEPKKKGARPCKQQSKGTDENIANRSQKPAAVRSLPSDGSSVGSAASVLQQVIGGLDDDDMSSITETEEENISSLGPQEKEVTQNLPRELDVSPLKGETSTSRKRSRRLGQDAAAYYPSTDEESGSDSLDHNTGRKSARSRGVKRPRASESNVAGADGRKTKKAKRQPSLNRSLSHAEANEHALQRSSSHLDHLTEVQPTSSEAMINAA